MKDQRGVVYLETLIAFVPVFFFFLGTLQIADAGAAHLIVKHAATVAARAAVVVLPDDGVYYNDKDNAQLHQFAGLRRDDIESAADRILGANARLDDSGDNVSIAFSAQPIPTPTQETAAQKNRSFGERLLDTSNRGDGSEQNMRELVTVRVNSQYRCLVAALCARGFNMVSEAKLVYQGARYVYEPWTNGVRNAANKSHDTNGNLVNAANQSPSPDSDPSPGFDSDQSDPDDGSDPPADDGDEAAPPDSDPDDPGSNPVANNGNGQQGDPGSGANGSTSGGNNSGNSNASNASGNNSANSNGSNPANPNGNSSNNSNGSNASANNSGNPNASNPSNASSNNSGSSNGPNGSSSSSNNSNGSNASNASANNSSNSNPSNASPNNSSNSNGSNGSSSSSNANTGNSNNSNASANNSSNPNASNPSNASSNSSGNSNGPIGSNSSSNANNSGNSNASKPSNASNGSKPPASANSSSANDSKPEIVARPPQDDSSSESDADRTQPGGESTSNASSSDGKRDGKSSNGNSDPNRPPATANAESGNDSSASSSSQKGDGAKDRDTSRPGRGNTSSRGPPTARDIVAGTAHGNSNSPSVGGRTSASSSAHSTRADGSKDGTPKLSAQQRRAQQKEKLRNALLRKAVAAAERDPKYQQLSPADRAFLESDPRNKELAYDPDTKTFKPQEARAALQAEADGVIPGPVRRAFDNEGRSRGADYIDGDGNEWDVKDAKAGADSIVAKAKPAGGKPGENVLVDASGLTPDEQAALEREVAAKLPPGSGKVRFVPQRPSAGQAVSNDDPPNAGPGGGQNDGDDPNTSDSDDDNPNVAESQPDDDSPNTETASNSEGESGSQNASQPSRGNASPRSPPSAAKIVAGATSGDSDSRSVASRDTSNDDANQSTPAAIVSGAAREGQLTPDGTLGRDAEGRLHLAVEFPACFVAGTYVQTPGGPQPIESIAEGSHVLAFDSSSNAIVQRPVLRSFVREARIVVDLAVESDEGTSTITGTPEHPFYVPERDAYVGMGELTPGMVLRSESNGHSVRVVSSRRRTGEFQVYNLEVRAQHNYFVAASSSDPGVLVHNDCEPEQNGDDGREEFFADKRDNGEPTNPESPANPPEDLADRIDVARNRVTEASAHQTTGRTYAVGESGRVNGWGHETETVINVEYTAEMGEEHPGGRNDPRHDQGNLEPRRSTNQHLPLVHGGAAASHAEQLVGIVDGMNGVNEPIGVSRQQCGTCRNWFREHAQQQQQTYVVADPKYTRVYYPNGEVSIYDKDGKLLMTVNEPPSASTTRYRNNPW